MRRIGGRRAILLGAILALVLTGTALAAFQQLPPGDQVNNDPAAGIDPARPVNLDDPANSDVTGGSLAGGVQVPWSVFRQTTSGADQVFSRSFAAGHWTTRGAGTVGGRSSGSPTFSGSLNFDQGVDGEAPSIDFAGAGRAVPWATWYEGTTGTGFGGANNIFASRFDATQNKWVFAGQGRGNGGAGPEVPSLNIHTDQSAENPVVAGGSLANPASPGPWITWQETTPGGSDQIFVSKPIGPGTATCPVGTKPAGGAPIGGFCFQQTGVERVNGNADPSLNVDTTRDGIEPDIAFTGTNDKVPWVVWYEVGGAKPDRVFAAKGVDPTTVTHTGTADGGIAWVAVGGNGGQGVLDASANGGPCGGAAEASCTLNKDSSASAVDPRVAAGTMTPGNATVPWVAWEEAFGGHERIFVSRLVGAGAAAHFVIANSGNPLPTVAGLAVDATRPDITFSGNTPYVSWHEAGRAVYGHFTTPDSFVIDNGPVGSDVSADVRAPISSGCTANPFNADGSACQAGAVGTPFFLFTDSASTTPKLLADAYQTDAPITGGASAVGSSAALVSASVNPQGAAVNVQFQFGTSTAYGQATALQRLGPANSPVSFAAALTGLPAGTTIHYRAVAITDFGTVVGDDRTLNTTAPTKPKVRIKILKTTIKKLRKGGSLKVKVTFNEAGAVRLTSSVKGKLHRKNRTVTFGRSKKVTFTKAQTKTVSIKPSRRALALMAKNRKVRVTVRAKAKDLAGLTASAKASRTIKRR